MAIDSIAAPRTGRIAGTLHRRGHAYPVPAPVRDENLPRGETPESEVADRHRDSGQDDPKSK